MYPLTYHILAHHFMNLYLFTCDDLLTIVLTNTICGTALPMARDLVQHSGTILDLILRVPFTSCWIWVNLLLFNISNQSQPGAIPEDSLNKPWRPLPAGRLDSKHITKYKIATSLTALAISFRLGGISPCLCLQVLTFWYNDLRGGDHWCSRNIINAGGYFCFVTGAMQVATGVQSLQYSDIGQKWLYCISIVVAGTIHIQDIYDQPGDRLRGPKTIPLILGDVVARYTVALPVLIFSFLAPAFWKLSPCGFLPTVILGGTVGIRLVGNAQRAVAHDKRTFIYWSCWIISIQLTPLWA